MDDLRKTRFEELKAAGLLPSPQGVALAILEAIRGPDTEIQQVTHLVQADPALAGRLLRYANAALGGALRPIASLQHAIVFLGLFRVRQVVLGFSLIDQYRSGKCEAFDYPAYWATSLATAVAAQRLAKLAQSPPDESFACGLLSGIGRLGLATAFPQEYARLLRAARSPQALLEAEVAEFGIDHAQLSADMLASWGLPELFADAVRYHEDLSKSPASPGTRAFALTAALQCAMQIGRVLNLDEPQRWEMVPLLYEAAAQVGVEEQEVPAVLEGAAKDWQQWTRELTLPSKHYSDIRQLLAAPPSQAAGGDSLAHVLPHLRLALVVKSAKLRGKLDRIIQTWEIQASEFKTIYDFLVFLGQEAPNVLIFDLDSSVEDAVRRVRSVRDGIGPGLPILVLIPPKAEDAVAELMLAGATDYLSSDFSDAALVARLTGIQRLLALQDTLRIERELVVSASGKWARANRRLLREALTDPLTQLPNRRYGMDRFAQEWSIALSNALPIACLMLDIDHFKCVNDERGHDTGDLVLRQVASTVELGCRRSDIVFRYGGEEFCCICPGSSLQDAVALAERIGAAIRQGRFGASGAYFPVTVSIGVAEIGPGVNGPDELIARADKALYVAKNSGRDCVRAYGG